MQCVYAKFAGFSLGQGRRAKLEVTSKCVLVNARSLKNKIDEFHAEIIRLEDFPSVIGVTETWLDDGFPDSLFQCTDAYD